MAQWLPPGFVVGDPGEYGFLSVAHHTDPHGPVEVLRPSPGSPTLAASLPEADASVGQRSAGRSTGAGLRTMLSG